MATPHPMTLPREGTTLLIVDVQERLFPAMDADHREEVMRNIKVLVATARRLRLPVVATEQYPKGLGHTLRELSEALGPEVQPVPKVSFSCLAAKEVRAQLRASATLDLMGEGLAVHVPADAVTSRTQGNWRLGTEQLRQAGAVVTATETLVFQLLGQADTDDFRELARLVR
jgi:nicotinamidase-related amidase